MKKMFSLLLVVFFLSANTLNAFNIDSQDCAAYATQAANAEVAELSITQEFASHINGEYDRIKSYWLGYCEGSNNAGAEALQPGFI